MGTRFPTGMAKRYVTKPNDRDYLRTFSAQLRRGRAVTCTGFQKKHQKMNSADNEAIQD